MTHTKKSNSMVIPGFSTLKMKQELQERVYRNTEGMTREEVREYIRKGSEAFQREGAARREQMQQEAASTEQ